VRAGAEEDQARRRYPLLRKLLPQEWLRFGWYFLVSRRDPKGLAEWIRLRRLGRDERFGQP
jgi:rhamnopyranosyl-N-acetylglucosaminyl-diphospho-decaprenol beta-1,3/1,4-galactofuranosyltransferase